MTKTGFGAANGGGARPRGRLRLWAGAAAAAVTAVAAASMPTQSVAQATTPVSFTADQASRGEATFKVNCAPCHGAALQGVTGIAPTLTGDGFKATWFGQPAEALYTFVSTSMPQDRPGALTGQEYADLVSFILSFNGVAAGDKELPPDAAALALQQVPPA